MPRARDGVDRRGQRMFRMKRCVIAKPDSGIGTDGHINNTHRVTDQSNILSSSSNSNNNINIIRLQFQ
jgi:hypothetical protein